MQFHYIKSSCMFLLVLQLKKGIITLYTMFVCSVGLCTIFDHYQLISMALYYFRWLYTTFDGFILLSMAIYYFRRYTLLLSFHDCDFVRTQDYPRHFWELKGRLEVNINLLTLIQCRIFCKSMVFPKSFNSSVCKCYFRENFLYLALEMETNKEINKWKQIYIYIYVCVYIYVCIYI